MQVGGRRLKEKRVDSLAKRERQNSNLRQNLKLTPLRQSDDTLQLGSRNG